MTVNPRFPGCPLPKNTLLSTRLQQFIDQDVFIVARTPGTNHSNGTIKRVGNDSVTIDVKRALQPGLKTIKFTELIQLNVEGLTSVPQNTTPIEKLIGPRPPFGYVFGEEFELFLVRIGKDFAELIVNDTFASLINRVIITRHSIRKLVCEEHEE